MKKIGFLDVGHGDCSVIYILNGSSIVNTFVIDIPNSFKLRKVLTEANCRSIDAIIISHSDVDHSKDLASFIDGFIDIDHGVIKKIIFNLDKIIDEGKSKTKYVSMLKSIHNATMKHKLIRESGSFDLTREKRKVIYEDNGELISILYPSFDDMNNASIHPGSTNNMSIVCLCEGGNSSILFTGDLESIGWIELFKRESIRCDILKMPHHGAKLDDIFSIDKVLEKLAPKIAIISSGENTKYMHPSKETIDYLKKRQISVYCTQLTSACQNKISKGEKCFGDIYICDCQEGYLINSEVNRSSLKCREQNQ